MCEKAKTTAWTKIPDSDDTLVNIGLNMTGRTSDVTGVSSPIVILHRVYCRSRRRELKRFDRESRRGASRGCFAEWSRRKDCLHTTGTITAHQHNSSSMTAVTIGARHAEMRLPGATNITRTSRKSSRSRSVIGHHGK